MRIGYARGLQDGRQRRFCPDGMMNSLPAAEGDWNPRPVAKESSL